ncbi:hypothetical protein Xen7305DRAFT_00013440 [Xenococcus sp. PCC 7305]|uniref:AAA-like domain-containing protein n=1 Tax=Xenococcus sp. PCC 7305 TaxID=102125 RepID=UPI0002ACB3F2|nr:AAA-like domain-containing protein [Xenococcus sp. PCC 7305]ELS01639.1 hypothetical protein Xen7305DRAFT_00013440 [Xenococcus sp. PCC 7305]
MSDLPPKRILILSANPKGTTPLRLGEEIREIKEGLRRAKRREQFVIESAEAVRYRDLHRAILDYEPQILHFSGHGVGSQKRELGLDSARKLSPLSDDIAEPEGLVFEDETGKEKLVEAEALANLFELFSNQLECVVLNACYSEMQAKAIAEHIPYVVGMSKAIADQAAIEFSVGFYDALGAGRDYIFAHKLGCSAIATAGIRGNLTPILVQLKSSSPRIKSNYREQGQGYYINRPPVEKNCFWEIEQAGALLRIKASEKMGKSLLLGKIFEEGSKKNYAKVRIDLQLLEASILSDSSQFLRWLCKRITRKLKLESCLEDYFDDFTANTGCTDYFEEYILESLDTPLILGIDNIDRLFAPEFKIIADDFFGLLRSWYENRASNWEKLRLIVIYSTEDLPRLNINQSPFNVGTKIELPDFEEEQVLELALRYNLDWSINEAQQLKELVGEHPYLVHHGIKSLKMNAKLTFSELVEKADTDSGIYADHLQHHWSTLEQEPTLARQLETIVESAEPIELAPSYLYKLDSMGLITKVGNQVQPRCQIYRDYFRERLLTIA